MPLPTIFEACRPRSDVLRGSVTEADFAADLAQVILDQGSKEYTDPKRFFANTYPTRGLKALLANVCGRLSGSGDEVAAIFRLDTSYGGGKTHGLIALTHAARGMQGVPNVAEFLDPKLIPQGNVRIAAFDGENADPANGRTMGDGIRAHTPWGEIAYALAGKQGFERVRKSDEERVAPGAETLRELFGGEPTLILLDELSVYLRKVGSQTAAKAQLTAFLTSLFKAVENASNAALVYTLAIGKDGRAIDAYVEENQYVADNMAEVESVSARKATLLNPTEDDETVQVLRRRLFESIDEDSAATVVNAYRELWADNEDSLPTDVTRASTTEGFKSSYPLHPEVLETLTSKMATLSNFQRVRGMLRLLARTIGHLWKEQPADAAAIHPHHIDPRYGPIHQEIVTRLGQSAYSPAISNDIAASGAGKMALAQEIDAEHHRGLPPYTVYAARTIFLHTLAFNEPLKGISPERLRHSILCPALDISFIDEARKKFITESAYLDDRPGAPMRFRAEANLRQIIGREERHVDAGEARAELNDRIREIFSGKVFDPVLFPGGPFDVPDEVGDGSPKLAIIAYDGMTVGESVERVPDLVERIYSRKGSEGSALRALRNHLVFVVADESRKEEMRQKAYHRLALRELKKPERLIDLAEYQQDKVRELESRSRSDLAIAIQQCYRHIFYPSRNRIGDSDVDLAHTAIDVHSASEKPGAGEKQIIRSLRDLNKLRLSEDEPDSPAYVRDRTPLKKGQISTFALRNEFRRDPALPTLVGDGTFIRGILRGVEQNEYVYQSGDLLFGPGDPAPSIMIDEQSFVFTMDYARKQGVWPRPAPSKPDDTDDDTGSETSGPTNGDGGSVQPPEPPQKQYSFSAEGVLRDALVRLWEQARSRKVDRIAALTIRMFESGDAFRLLGSVGSVSGAKKKVTFEGGYETPDGGTFELEFHGSVPDAEPVREFLQTQLRGAASTSLRAEFELTFEKGLEMQGDGAEKLTTQLAKFASGAAYVSATAEAKIS